VAYALGSALEGHDEVGVSIDPHLGDRGHLYLQAMDDAALGEEPRSRSRTSCSTDPERALAAGLQAPLDG
jgi:hypothetical protein